MNRDRRGAAKGYRVFGTALKPEEIADLKHASGGAVSLTICDITDEVAVTAWVREVTAQTEGGLDLLIQNAGRLTPGPLEVLKLEAIKREFDVNVFAALTVSNAFLPALRQRRGRIVYISTWTASLPLPFNGPSGASKAALEVIATIQRAEFKPFGVEVVVAAPGAGLYTCRHSSQQSRCSATVRLCVPCRYSNSYSTSSPAMVRPHASQQRRVPRPAHRRSNCASGSPWRESSSRILSPGDFVWSAGCVARSRVRLDISFLLGVRCTRTLKRRECIDRNTWATSRMTLQTGTSG
jgi:NAD(P)-dependent dehydrogenase (short-subunit alcohol dehydrogenase family)